MVKEGGDRFRVPLYKLRAADHHTGDQRGGGVALRLDRIPLLGEIQRHTDIFALGLSGGDKGLRQHGNGVLLRHEGGQALGLLALPFDGHIGGRVNAVLGQHIVEGVFRRIAFSAGVDGLAPQILHRVDGVAAFHDVKHTQGIDGQHPHAALGIVVEDGGQIGRYGGKIRGPLGQSGGDLIGDRGDAEVVVVVGEFACVRLAHEFHHAHGSGALEGHHIHIHWSRCFLRSCGFRLRYGRRSRLRAIRRCIGVAVPAGASGQKCGRQGQRAKQREQLFHRYMFFLSWSFGVGGVIEQFFQRGRVQHGEEVSL